MKYSLIALTLVTVLTSPVFAASGDPRLIQGTIEWPATLASEPIVIVRGDDGRVYAVDISGAVRHGGTTLRGGERVALLALEAGKPHELTGLVIGSGDAATLARALSQGLTPVTSPAAAASAPPAAAASASAPTPTVVWPAGPAPAPAAVVSATAPPPPPAAPPGAAASATAPPPAPAAVATSATTPPPAPAVTVTPPPAAPAVAVTPPPAASAVAVTPPPAAPAAAAGPAAPASVAKPGAVTTSATGPQATPGTTSATPPASTAPAPANGGTGSPPTVTPPAPAGTRVATAPGERKQWGRVDGRVYSVEPGTLILRDSSGALVRVDISNLNPNVTKSLRPGGPVSVYGYPLEQRFEAAGYIELDPQYSEPPRTRWSR